eukprot:GHVS01024076.1.p1 GENE.GHVS01024076.1~~GHVS01024076.1.p1  ORF type:complete len:205 (-),score=18.41 GHVS01024076.1:139-753(-)
MLCGMWPTACCYRECFFFRLVKFSGFDSLTGMTGSNICFKSDQDEFKDLTALVTLQPTEQGAVNKYFIMKDKTLELVEETDVSNNEKKVLHFGVLAEEGVDRLREKEYALTKSADDNTWTVLRAEKRKLRKVHLEEILKEVGGKAVVYVTAQMLCMREAAEKTVNRYLQNWKRCVLCGSSISSGQESGRCDVPRNVPEFIQPRR